MCLFYNFVKIYTLVYKNVTLIFYHLDVSPIGPADILNLSDTSSVDTIALLQSALPHSSPELQVL